MEGYTLTLYLGFAAGAGLLALRLFPMQTRRHGRACTPPLALMVRCWAVSSTTFCLRPNPST